MKRGLILCCGSILVMLFFQGCSGNSLDRQAVGGSVKLSGQPLDYGMINFIPQEKATVGGGAVITNGAYEIPSDKGLPPGKYLVRICSTTPDNSNSLAPRPERIAPQYNIKSELTVEVVSGETNRFDFDVTGK